MLRPYMLLVAALAFSFLIGGMLSPLAAQERVAIAEMPPYAVKEGEGRWSGPALDLFRAAAERNGTSYTLSEVPLERIGDTAGSGAAVAFPVIAGAELPNGVTRTLPFQIDSVGLIGKSNHRSFLSGLAGLFNLDFLKVVGMVSALLLAVGAIFWLVERQSNPDVTADARRLGGIGNGFWWAGVTATTIGYGDMVPKTIAGRFVAMVWMLFSMALTAILTAYLISLTGAESGRSSLSDAVSGERIGVVTNGMIGREDLRGAEFLREFATLDLAIAALDEERIDAVAYPYQQAKEAAGTRRVMATEGSIVLPVFHVAGPEGLRKEIDRIILSPWWQERVRQASSSGGR